MKFESVLVVGGSGFIGRHLVAALTARAIKVTVPGPLTLIHPTVSNPGGMGKPSSLTMPLRIALARRLVVWSGPALADGERFGGKAEPDSSRSKLTSLLARLA